MESHTNIFQDNSIMHNLTHPNHILFTSFQLEGSGGGYPKGTLSPLESSKGVVNKGGGGTLYDRGGHMCSPARD